MIDVKSYIRHHYRYLVVLVTFLLLGSIMMCVDFLTIVRIQMEKKSTLDSNSTESRIYTEKEINFLLSASAVGTLIGTYVFDVLYTNFGARYVQFSGGILCAVSTSAFPIVADESYIGALFIRVIQGFSYASDFPTIGLVTSQWAPIKEIGLFLAIISSFTNMKYLVTIPLNLSITPFANYRVLYHVFAGIVLVMSILWLIIYRDKPDEYEIITKLELNKIQKSKTDKQNKMKIKVPWKKVSCNKYILALWFAALTDTFAGFCWATLNPLYFKSLGMGHNLTMQATLMTGMSFAISKIVGGIMSDRIKCISELKKIRIFSFVSIQLPALVLIPALFLNKSSWFWQIVLFCIFSTCTGYNVGSFYKSAALVSREYSHFVIGTIQIFKSISLLIIPQLHTLLTEIDKNNVWTYMFSIMIVVMTVGHTVYVPFMRADPIDFDDEKDKLGDRRNRQKVIY